MSHPFNLTKNAVRAIQKALDTDDNITYLRIGVAGSGCSGYEIKFKYEDDKKKNDLEFQFDDVIVIVDPKSIKFLDGATVDYHRSLMKADFKIDLPNAKFCGCGKSFSK